VTGGAEPIDAVLFDLDDTLFPQEAWLAGAWDAVARAAEPAGVDPAALRAALRRIAAEGSDRGGIIDRALRAVTAAPVAVGPLVDAFRRHRAGALAPYPRVPELVRRLRSVVPVGLVSDGDVGIQRDKLRAIGMEDAFDVVVWSDELGRDRRKPAPAPFVRALELLGLPAARVVFVGDRPDKDISGASGVGMRSLRVRTGEYAHNEDVVAPWATTAGVDEAIELILRTFA
jgi:putative hydrolase of the HAD superfamily